MYRVGRGVPQNDARAVRWYRLAADPGSAVAQLQLGLRYRDGRGVLQDNETAHMWFNLAASRDTGSTRDDAVINRDSVAERMSRDQIADAQRRALEWHDAHPPD
jgi:TPR repeat protein